MSKKVKLYAGYFKLITNIYFRRCKGIKLHIDRMSFRRETCIGAEGDKVTSKSPKLSGRSILKGRYSELFEDRGNRGYFSGSLFLMLRKAYFANIYD